jgi:DNA-binding MarR family transcriptional regulator
MDIDVSGWHEPLHEQRPAKTPDLTKSPAFLLLLATNLMARPFADTIGRGYDITLAEWRCMMVLAPKPGLANIEVAEASGIDVMTASRALRRLEQHGRLERRPDPADKRRIVGRLTAKGTDLYKTIAVGAQRRAEHLLGDLNAQDRAQLSRYLTAIIARLR